MKVYEALTGAEVLRMRTELRLGRDQLHPLCAFPNSRSAARLSNIEKKDSWKEGDRERVARALRSVYVERGLPVPESLSEAELDGVPPVVPGPEYSDGTYPLPGEPEPVAVAVDRETGHSEPVPDRATCPHASGFTHDPERDLWVCVVCGDETAEAAAARLARTLSTAPPELAVGDTTEIAGITFTKVSEDPFPPVDVQAAPVDEEWEDLLRSWVDVDTSDVVAPDYRTTNSEYRTFKRCPRQWWLAYYRRLAPRVANYTSARATGDRVHRALQAAYVADRSARTDPRDALERVIVEDWTEITKVVTDPTELAFVKERFDAANALERAMVEGYAEWLAENGADADYELDGAEQVLSARLDVEVDGRTYLVELLGKLDARLRRKSDGARLFLDHKTVTSLTDVVPTLRQNEQMLTYVLLEALNATDDDYVAGALYNMLRKVKRTARANPPFYDRLEVHHNVHEVASFRARLVGQTRDLLRKRAELDAGADHREVAYPNPTGDCRFDCDFFRVCGMFDDGSPGVEDAVAALYVEVDPLERYGGLPPTTSEEGAR